MQFKSKITGVLLTSLALGFPAVSFAQTPVLDTASVAAECAKSAVLCKAAVEAAITALKALGLTPAQLNTQLGVLAGAALSGAKSLPAAEKTALAGMLTVISAASSNPQQILALTQLASQLAAGDDIDLAAFASAISAS